MTHDYEREIPYHKLEFVTYFFFLNDWFISFL